MSDKVEVDPMQVIYADAAAQARDLAERVETRARGLSASQGYGCGPGGPDVYAALQHLRDAELRFQAAAGPVHKV